MERDAQQAGAPGDSSGGFPRTRWTLVEALRHGGDGGQRALGELCSIYWYPVYAFLRMSGSNPADADDLTQGFFMRLLERNSLAAADEEKGKLRTYLLVALKRFRINEYRRETAQKRGGLLGVIELDAAAAEERFSYEPKELDDPEKLFERRWALSLMEEALGRLEAEYSQSGKDGLFDALSPVLAGGVRDDPNYAELGEVLDMTAGAVQVAVHRMRKRFRRQFEAVVGETLENPESLEEELRHVLSVISG